MTEPTNDPTPDLGYPTKAHGRIPAFRSVEEEAAFWDTHDIVEHLDDLAPVKITFAKNLAGPLSVRLDPHDQAELARRAREQGIGPSTLIRMWVKERLRQEAAAAAKAR